MIAALPAGTVTVAVWSCTATRVDCGGGNAPCGPTCCPPRVMSVVADRPAEDEVVSAAVERAAALAAKHGPTLGAIKEGMYAETLALLRDQTPIAFG